MENREFEKKLISAPVREKLDLLKQCGKCIYNSVCWSVPTGHCLIKKECINCGWIKADPDPCEGCQNQELFTRINHQYDNEI